MPELSDFNQPKATPLAEDGYGEDSPGPGAWANSHVDDAGPLPGGAALLIDASQRIIAVSRQAAAMLGRPSSELVDATCDSVLKAHFAGGESICHKHCSSIACLSDGKSYSVDDCLVSRKDGSTIRVAMHTQALVSHRENAGEPLGLIMLSELDVHHHIDEPCVELNEREISIIKLIALGHSIKSIGRELGISPKTVEYHRTSAGRKLGLSNRVEIVQYAIRKGWVHPPEDSNNPD